MAMCCWRGHVHDRGNRPRRRALRDASELALGRSGGHRVPRIGEPWEPSDHWSVSVEEGAAVADRLGVLPVMAEGGLPRLPARCRYAEILHLATHGYYLDAELDGGLSARLTSAAASHPLVSSGIALAGATPGRGRGARRGHRARRDRVGTLLAPTSSCCRRARVGWGRSTAARGCSGWPVRFS